MIPVPLNEAEAIFAPFFDGSDSDMCTDKACLLSDFDILCGEGSVARAVQTWCSVNVVIERAPIGVTALTLRARTPLAVTGYDLFRVFAALPTSVRLRITGVVDGHERIILEGHVGDGGMEEIDGRLFGERLDTFSLEFALLESLSATVQLRWLGLANRAAQTKLEARPSPYTPDWPHCLYPEDPEKAGPEIGILFGPEDLERLRAKSLSGPLKPLCDTMRREVETLLALEPEKMIGTLVPSPDLRWTRVRDNWKRSLYHLMEPLALMGLIDNNPEMSRMAARMALSAAHCGHWCESPMGVLPGATWHHRSFQETYYAAACALVLDLAGAWITPHGKQIIRDAIVMKGFPRMESDFKRMEYIRYMNQGIVFSIGRLFGLLSLMPVYPRYASQLEEAERDLHEMIDSYIQEDGVILEGPGYWAHSFLDIVPLYVAMARHRGRALRDYATEKVLRAGDYALSLLSTTGDGTGYLGINDAHNQGRYPLHVVAAYCLMSDRPEWKTLLAAQLRTASDGGFGSAISTAFALIIAACSEIALDDAKESETEGKLGATPRTDLFPVGGQAASVRLGPDLGAVHLHLCSGPTYPGHFHEDKGSIILEAAGQSLVVDRGILAYHETENAFLGRAGAHSLLYPEPGADGLPYRQPGARPAQAGGKAWGVLDLSQAYGGRLGSSLAMDDILMLVSDNTPAWPDGLFRTNLRRIASPAPTLFLIEDLIESDQALAMSFLLHTPQVAVVRGSEVWITAPGVTLRVAPVGWSPSVVEAAACSIDDHHRPLNRVRLTSALARTHRLLTVLELLPAGATAGRWEISEDNGGLRMEYGETAMRYGFESDNSARVKVRCGHRERHYEGTANWRERAL